jgi:hypothetical protein
MAGMKQSLLRPKREEDVSAYLATLPTEEAAAFRRGDRLVK